MRIPLGVWELFEQGAHLRGKRRRSRRLGQDS